MCWSIRLYRQDLDIAIDVQSAKGVYPSTFRSGEGILVFFDLKVGRATLLGHVGMIRM